MRTCPTLHPPRAEPGANGQGMPAAGERDERDGGSKQQHEISLVRCSRKEEDVCRGGSSLITWQHTWRAGMQNGLPRSVGGKHPRWGSSMSFSGTSSLHGSCGAQSPARSCFSCSGSMAFFIFILIFFFVVGGCQGGGAVYSFGRYVGRVLA